MSQRQRKGAVSQKNGKAVKQPRNRQMVDRKSKGPSRSAPLASSRVMRTGVPSVSGSPYLGDGRVRIKHREYVRDISGSVAFGSSSLPVNPGISVVFPWLSIIAPQFESYLFRSLSFEYETQKSASTSGSLMLAMDFDAADSAPLNKQTLMAYHNAVRSAVWEECVYRADSADLAKFGVQRYIRSGGLSANLDIKTYDVGNLFVATQGEADTSAIGELYVVYDVELITPQFAVDLALNNSVTIATTGSSRAAPFTGTQTSYGGLAVTASAATVVFNKPGKYLLTTTSAGTVFADVEPTITGTAALTLVGTEQAHNTAGTLAVCQYLVSVTDYGMTAIFDFSGACTTLTSCTLRVAPFSDGVIN